MVKKILLRRPQERINRYCAYQVLLDREEQFHLKPGEEKPLLVQTDDTRKIKAKMQFVGSKELSVSNLDDQIELKVSANLFLNFKMPLLSLIVFFVSLLTSMVGAVGLLKIASTVCILLVMAALVAALIFYRNNWLTLEPSSKK